MKLYLTMFNRYKEFQYNTEIPEITLASLYQSYIFAKAIRIVFLNENDGKDSDKVINTLFSDLLKGTNKITVHQQLILAESKIPYISETIQKLEEEAVEQGFDISSIQGKWRLGTIGIQAIQ